MLPDGAKTIAQWREAGEWWNNEPPREVTRYIDGNGIRRETFRELPLLTDHASLEQQEYVEDGREDWSLRHRKIRDEKASAACGALPEHYYQEMSEERLSHAGVSAHHPQFQARSSCFAPLHLLSGYAFGRSTLLPEELAQAVAGYGFPAAAITDPFSLVGCVEFARSCRKHGVKPLIGASLELPEGGEIVLIARSKHGYSGLCRLITSCHLSEERLYPLARWERLETFSEDLLCLTGGDRGPLNRLISSGNLDAAYALTRKLISIYGTHNVYIEIERSFLPWQIHVNDTLEHLASSLGLHCVAGGEITHHNPSDFPAQDILVCADTLCSVDEVIGRKPVRSKLQPQVPHLPQRALNAERYLRTASEMQSLYSDRPYLLANSLLIADRCDDDVLPSRTRVPQLFPDDNHALREIVLANALSLYPKLTSNIQRRLELELERIIRLNFAGHFLIAWDFCRWAREQAIEMSGRGSVVDSAVAYCLGFTRIDAIRHRLHFDRFLPDDGTKRPDIDIDFEARRRNDVRRYLTDKYGEDRVATVSAIGAYCSRGIIREVGKALGIPAETVSYLAKKVHGGIAPDQLEVALAKRPELREAGISKERFQWVFRLAAKLTDIPRNIRSHSSGVVIADQNLQDIVPVMNSASIDGGSKSLPEQIDQESSGQSIANVRIIQWDKRSAKHYFDKFDILCLRGQDVLSNVQERIRINNPDFRVEQVPTDQPDTYRALRSGELIGIPQSASPAMRQAHMRLRTQDLTDASLVQAGIRPGVGGAVKINELIARRRGKAYSFEHPDLESILGHTYGIIVFQEQVDQLLQVFGGYSSGEAEDIRDLVHKRRREDYGRMIRNELIQRVLDNGYSYGIAEQVYELVAGFKGYGFAQGHALAFAEISVRSVYCQQNYPSEYFASILSAQPAGYYGPCTLVNEARSRGVTILNVCVENSRMLYSVEDAWAGDPPIRVPTGAVRVGLMQVSGVSHEVKERIIAFQSKGILAPIEDYAVLKSVTRSHSALALEPPRPSNVETPSFHSLYDFAMKIKANRDEFEQLVLCGALDCLHSNRRAILWSIPQILGYVTQKQRSVERNELPFEDDQPDLVQVDDFDDQEKTVFERAILGLDVRFHLMQYERRRVESKGALTTDQARRLPSGTKGFVVGNPIRLRFPPTPSGKRVVFFDLEDETGLLNVTAFDAVYQQDGQAIVCSPYVTVVGEAQDRDGHTAFLAHRVFPYRPSLLRDRLVDLPVTRGDFLISGSHGKHVVRNPLFGEP